MNYLLPDQVIPHLRSKNCIEQFLGAFYSDGFGAFKFINVYREKEKYIVLLFAVFDDRIEGVDSIYDFSPVDPETLYGKELYASSNIEKCLEYCYIELNAKRDYFMPANYLDGILD